MPKCGPLEFVAEVSRLVRTWVATYARRQIYVFGGNIAFSLVRLRTSTKLCTLLRVPHQQRDKMHREKSHDVYPAPPLSPTFPYLSTSGPRVALNLNRQQG